MNKDVGNFMNIYTSASIAGREAAEAAVPTPMIVGTAVGLSTEIDYSKPTYRVNEGVCGFAWVTIRPGNSPFANWLKKNNLARKAYGGGVQIWIGDYNQSMTRKEEHAYAMARVLTDNGITAYAGSRMD